MLLIRGGRLDVHNKDSFTGEAWNRVRIPMFIGVASRIGENRIRSVHH